MAGYSSNPLYKKLGIKSGYTLYIEGTPDHYFTLIQDLPEEVEWIADPSPLGLDFVHYFTRDKKELPAAFARLKPLIKKTGMIWISWPKGKSKIPKDIKDSDIRAAGLAAGLVDCKVCAIDQDWSGLKFMYRIKDR